MNNDIVAAQGSAHLRLTGSRILAAAAQRYCTTISIDRAGAIRNFYSDQECIYFLESGFAVATKHMRDGRQQNVAIFVPGDILNHELVTMGGTLVSLSALTESKLFSIEKSKFLDILASDPLYGRLFLRFVAYQGVLAQEWILGLGRRNALERTAHLLCEMFYRMRMAGLTIDGECPLPLTQSDIANVLGLSLVQQNRSLRSLYYSGFVEISNKRLLVLDWDGLVKTAHFDQAYIDASIESALDLSGSLLADCG